MTTNSIFFRTLSFCWLKLGLGILNIVIDAVLLAILVGISLLFNSEGVFGVLLLVWLGCIGLVNFIMNHYLGYMAKAGHVAVIAESFRTGEIPDAPISTGKRLVLGRFGTANVYFGIDKLVGGAIKQIQRMLGKLTGGILSMIPGGEKVQKAIDYFLELSLGYIDECCLCYTFYKQDDSPYRNAADGVVLYAQNWKALLKNAAWIMIVVFSSVIVITLIIFVIMGLGFRALEWNGFIAFILSLLLAWTIKYAFVDSWIMVKMVHRYMSLAKEAPPAIDLYGKLTGWSASFKELLSKGKEEAPATTDSTETGTDATPAESTPTEAATPTAPEPAQAAETAPADAATLPAVPAAPAEAATPASPVDADK